MRTNGIRYSRMIGIVLLASVLAACGGAQGDLEKWIAEVKARPAPPLDPLPVMQQFETFEYASQNMRDPFSEAFSGGAGSGNGAAATGMNVATHGGMVAAMAPAMAL